MDSVDIWKFGEQRRTRDVPDRISIFIFVQLCIAMQRADLWPHRGSSAEPIWRGRLRYFASVAPFLTHDLRREASIMPHSEANKMGQPLAKFKCGAKVYQSNFGAHLTHICGFFGTTMQFSWCQDLLLSSYTLCVEFLGACRFFRRTKS